MFMPAVSPKTLPEFISTLRKEVVTDWMTDEDLERLLDLHHEAWDKHRWFFGSVLGWQIYQHQLFEITNRRHDQLEETNPGLFYRFEDEFSRCAYYFDDIIQPTIRFALWLRLNRLFYKLSGTSPHRPVHN